MAPAAEQCGNLGEYCPLMACAGALAVSLLILLDTIFRGNCEKPSVLCVNTKNNTGELCPRSYPCPAWLCPISPRMVGTSRIFPSASCV